MTYAEKRLEKRERVRKALEEGMTILKASIECDVSMHLVDDVKKEMKKMAGTVGFGR